MKTINKLEELLDALENDAIEIPKVIYYMTSAPVYDDVAEFLRHPDPGKYDRTDFTEMGLILKIANFLYTYTDVEPWLTDSEYDQLTSLYQKGTGDLSFTVDTKNGSEKEYHKYPSLRGTLDKVYSLGKSDETQKVNKHRESIDQWIKRTEETLSMSLGREISLTDEPVLCFPKWDGVSCIFEFDEDGKLERALTRGHIQTNTAKNITQHFPDISEKGKHIRGLKTEIMVKNEDVLTFGDRVGKAYRQSRSVASAIINSKKELGCDDLLVIKKLRYIENDNSTFEDLHPEVYDDPYLRCRLSDREAILEFAEKCRVINGLRCDGIVIRLMKNEYIRALGRDKDRNKYEVAYKFTEVYAYTKVEDIVFQLGLFGRITPVVKFNPVTLKGNRVKSASLGSMAVFRRLQLSKGDTIKVMYDIIPYVVIDDDCIITHSDEFTEPKYCPDCGKALYKEGDIVSCENEKCDWVMKGKILNYINKMRIDHISSETIVKLFDAGFLRVIPDLYRLKEHKKEICKIDGISKVMLDKILKSIEKASKNISDYILIGAIGIEGNSTSTFEKIFGVYSLDELLSFARNNQSDMLTVVEGIGDKKAKQILKGIKKYQKLIEELLKYIDITWTDVNERNPARFKVCFTKIRDDEKSRYIWMHGGTTVDNVTKDTAFLVVPDMGVDSGSVQKAKKYEIPIVHIDDVESYIEKYWR